MHSNQKKPISRRDFLKGLGLAGSGALLTLLRDQEAREVQAGELKKDPLKINFNINAMLYYGLETEGGTYNGFFSTCSNIGYETETVDQSQGSDVIHSYQPGRSRILNITLERGLTANMDMWEWMEMVKDGSNYQKNATIIAYDQGGTPQAQWNLINCWPCDVSAILTSEMRERTVLTLESFERTL